MLKQDFKMLENTIKKYHNKILTATEVIEELIKLIKIVDMDNGPKQWGCQILNMPFIHRREQRKCRKN